MNNPEREPGTWELFLQVPTLLRATQPCDGQKTIMGAGARERVVVRRNRVTADRHLSAIKVPTKRPGSQNQAVCFLHSTSRVTAWQKHGVCVSRHLGTDRAQAQSWRCYDVSGPRSLPEHVGYASESGSTASPWWNTAWERQNSLAKYFRCRRYITHAVLVKKSYVEPVLWPTRCDWRPACTTTR